jgi:hypothetical protein
VAAVNEILIREAIPGGQRETAFVIDGAELRAVRRVDDFGRGGQLKFGPEYATDEAQAEAEAVVAETLLAAGEPRRRKARSR